MTSTITRDDLLKRIASLELRISKLEQNKADLGLSFDVTSQNLIDLGPVDGESITGIKLSMHGRVQNAEGVMRIRPNGATSFLLSTLQSITYFNGESQAIVGRLGSDRVYGSGIPIASLDWDVAVNDIAVDGVFLTKMCLARIYQGQFTNIDLSVSGDRMVTGTQASQWYEGSVPIESFVVALDGSGLFTGRVTMEMIP
jgi:hypothetical protein